MGQQQEDLTRTLASALWRSAFSPYCRALDNWLAAEEMVAEALRAARAAPDREVDAEAMARSLPSSAFPVGNVRDLAQCFWENSTRSATLTLDIWLAAERHVRAFCRAALSGHGVLRPFSAQAHWRRIHDHAEWLWHAAGRPQDRDLDTWLRAEAEILAQAGSPGETPQQVLPDVEGAGDAGDAGDADRQHPAPRRPPELTLLVDDAEEDGASAAAPWFSPSRPDHHGSPTGL